MINSGFAAALRALTTLRACMLMAILSLPGMSAQALTLSSGDLQAAAALGCVLAEDALGYLDEEQFNRRFDSVVGDFSEERVDVIYAKALGYIDGLLFDVPAGEVAVAQSRLRAYSDSAACAPNQAVNHTVSL